MNTFSIVVAAMSLLALATGETVYAASTNNESLMASDCSTAWNDLQQAVRLPISPNDPPTDQFLKQQESLALSAADESQTFCLQFPDSTNAIAAKKLRCKMLETAYFSEYNTNVFRAWAEAQQAMLADPKVSGDDRFDLQVAIVTRKRSDPRVDYQTRQIEREDGLRELIKEYPKKDEPYEMLLNMAANSPREKARAIASETLALPVSSEVKAKAEGILRRLDAVGKPLDIKFVGLDGRQVDLSEMKGKVVLVDFWATWCGPCVAEIPSVKAAYEKLHSRGFEVVGISLDSDKQRLESYIEKNGMPWPEYFDGYVWQNKFAIQYGIAGIPKMWLVDKNGNLRQANAYDDLETKVEKLLEE